MKLAFPFDLVEARSERGILLPGYNDRHQLAIDSWLSKANGMDISWPVRELIPSAPYWVGCAELNQNLENDKIKHRNTCSMLANQPSKGKYIEGEINLICVRDKL